SDALDENLKKQLRGEALFVRAFTHFNLMNLYGDVPYITTTDFAVNKDVSRIPESQVYENILSDLLEAKTLLEEDYIGPERTRANKATVSALLARVYLYQENWQQAESESSLVINNTTLYNLETDLL